MKVLLLDHDTDYSKRIQYYLNKKFTQVQISVCDDIEAAKRMIVADAFDVILFDAEFDETTPEEINTLSGKSAFAYISETNEVVNDTETIVKYTRVSNMYEKICSLYEKKRNRIVKQSDDAESDKNNEIISFLPVHGGAGSSTMAAACALSLAEDYEVLYINLEQRPSDSVFFAGESKKGISDIVSTLKTKYTDAGLLQTINSVIQKDSSHPASNLYYIKGYSNIMDCLSMTEHSLDALLKVIREKMRFRFVVIDADFIVSPLLNTLITLSDKLVFVTSGADIANSKLAKIQRYLDILKRNDEYEMPENFLLLNQYYGMNDETTIARDMHILARIARYRTDDKTRISSKAVIGEVLSKENVFREIRPKQAVMAEQ